VYPDPEFPFAESRYHYEYPVVDETFRAKIGAEHPCITRFHEDMPRDPHADGDVLAPREFSEYEHKIGYRMEHVHDTADADEAGEEWVRFTEYVPSTIAKVIYEYLGHDWNQPLAFHVGEMLIMRNYHSPDFCRGLYDRIQWHVRAVLEHWPVSRYARELPQAPHDLHQAKILLVPLKRVDWVIHGTPDPPDFNSLFPELRYFGDTKANQRELARGVLDESFRQSTTVRGVLDKNWTRPEPPVQWPWKSTWPEFFITVFVTSYPNARPLGSDDGLSLDELEQRAFTR
jgi:hypothetical protein